MVNYYSQQTAGSVALPVQKPTDPGYGGKLYRFRAVISLGSVDTATFGTKITTGVTTADSVLLAIIPSGHLFDFGMITSTVSLGTSVVAIGTNLVHASNGQYRAAAAFTAVDTPTLFGSTLNAAAGNTLTADTPVYLTVGTATLPTTGTLVVDLYCNRA